MHINCQHKLLDTTYFQIGCSKPLGLITGEIQDWQLSSSSVRNADKSSRTKYARVYQPGDRAWCPQLSPEEVETRIRHHRHHHYIEELNNEIEVSSNSSTNEPIGNANIMYIATSDAKENSSHWLLVDLGVETQISGLLTQGKGDVDEWVSSFSLSYSDDAYRWKFIHDAYGKKKVMVDFYSPC